MLGDINSSFDAAKLAGVLFSNYPGDFLSRQMMQFFKVRPPSRAICVSNNDWNVARVVVVVVFLLA